MSATGPLQEITQSSFALFPYLPKELPFHIWRMTWQRRAINVLRQENVSQRRHPQGGFLVLNTRNLEELHTRAMFRDWGRDALDAHNDIREDVIDIFDEPTDPADRVIFNTITWSRSPQPTSLWVSAESRAETLRHYSLCFGLEGGDSQLYFNFRLDVLLLNCKEFPFFQALDRVQPQLSCIFQQKDLVRLQNVMLWNISEYQGWTERFMSQSRPKTYHSSLWKTSTAGQVTMIRA